MCLLKEFVHTETDEEAGSYKSTLQAIGDEVNKYVKESEVWAVTAIHVTFHPTYLGEPGKWDVKIWGVR